MNGADFWGSLEFRVCREFAGMREKRHRRLWCDGFAPGLHLLDDPVPRISGRTWLCDGPTQDPWKFTLMLAQPVASRDDVVWSDLLPSEGLTRWLSLDRSRKRMLIDPAAAAPDRNE